MPKSVLVVDDSLVMRRMVAKTLETFGYEVSQCEDGPAALQSLEAGPVDLIIVDLNMPDMDGITFVKQVRLRFPGQEVPILMLTSENLNSRVKEGREAGASGWLIKPFRAERLAEVVGRLLG